MEVEQTSIVGIFGCRQHEEFTDSPTTIMCIKYIICLQMFVTDCDWRNHPVI